MSDPYEADLDLDDDVPEDEEAEDQEVDPDEEADEPEEGEPDDDQEPEPAARAPSRGDRRIQALARERASEKARADALAAEMAAYKAAHPAQPQQPQETPQQLRERLAMMDPVDAAQYLIDQNSRRFEAQMAQIRWDAQESADKTSFENFCARNPVAAKLKDQVEQRLATMRAGGTTVSREVLLTHMLGERQLANSNRATGRAQRTAATNQTRQATRPTNGRGDAAPEGRTNNSTQARNKRLGDIQI